MSAESVGCSFSAECNAWHRPEAGNSTTAHGGTQKGRVTKAWSGRQEMDTGKASRWAGPKS